MKNNKVYFRRDALARHEDFDVWYADGDLFMSVRGPWKAEGDKVALMGRLGGEIGAIKPDRSALAYTIRMERYEYVLHTLRIFEHYSVEGMLWDVEGSLSDSPLDFVYDGDRKDVHVRALDFKDKGSCYEIKVSDVAKLRIACAAVIAMGIKEEYRGLSEGEKKESPSMLDKVRGFLFTNKGTSYEELEREA